ncbi:cytidyltransferase [Xanthomonas phage XaC1]|nr:cytidyltransferase [Xanthomonas phage XaC1]
MNNENVYVYIGRFQTAHIGHEATIKHAMQNCDRLVLLVGSSELARDPKNPFTFNERFQILDAVCNRIASEEWAKGRKVKYNIKPLHDFVYDNTKWLKEVQSQVLSCTKSSNITITGCRKDGDVSTYYLEFFPQWKQDFISEMKGARDKYGVPHVNVTVNSTAIRKEYLDNCVVNKLVLVPEASEFLEKFIKLNLETFELLQKEHKFVEQYKADMKAKLPYDNIPFLTGDALVVSAGHVLLVKRKTFPGKGLYALPGGFFDAWKDQSQVDTAIRELQEETRIKVPEKVLRGSIRKSEEFGDMNRSLRWRIITKCVHIQLPDNTLPKVKGADDAEKAFWMPLGDVLKNRDKFFEDHFSIMDHFLSL